MVSRKLVRTTKRLLQVAGRMHKSMETSLWRRPRCRARWLWGAAVGRGPDLAATSRDQNRDARLALSQLGELRKRQKEIWLLSVDLALRKENKKKTLVCTSV